ncbi:hypothetical protein V6U81_26690 [Micromonospora sp. CPCC 205711]|uniref:hypothetical protein n=1 Tax=Micromonospora sp. CPCC 205547 TaxID=3122400 RepID=UPI002FF332E5
MRLHVSREEAWRRAGTRRVFLTDAEFEARHLQDRRQPPAADHHLEVTSLDVEVQVEAVRRLWQPTR